MAKPQPKPSANTLTRPKRRINLIGRRIDVIWGTIAAAVAFVLIASPARAITPETLKSVVSVLPVWAEFRNRGGGKSEEPEGTGVVVRHGGYIVTNLHVVRRALSINVRLSDGRVMIAKGIGVDPLRILPF